MGSTGNLLVTALGAMASLVGVVMAAPWLMRKVNRDLVKAQTDKTAAETSDLRDRQAGLWLGRYEQRLAELDEYLDRQDECLAEHAAWDFLLFNAARQAGIEISDPPPLNPPRRTRGRRVRISDVDEAFLEGDSREGY
jgi:hypothetical protein